MTTARAYIKRADKARNFPTNTCPASRHAQIIGEMLIQKKSYPMLHEEPEHCGETILSVVTSLCLARTEIEKLKKKLSRGKEERAKVLAALEAITKHFSISRLHESTLADTTVRGQAHEAIAIMRKEPEPKETYGLEEWQVLALRAGWICPTPKPEPISDAEISLMAHNDDPGDWNCLSFRDAWHEGYRKGFKAALLEKAR